MTHYPTHSANQEHACQSTRFFLTKYTNVVQSTYLQCADALSRYETLGCIANTCIIQHVSFRVKRKADDTITDVQKRSQHPPRQHNNIVKLCQHVRWIDRYKHTCCSNLHWHCVGCRSSCFGETSMYLCH